jgi:PAS domain S-box-containing protein
MYNKNNIPLDNLINENKKQKKIYTKLRDIGRNINESTSVDELFYITSNFVKDELGFEKCIIFKHNDNNGWFKIDKSIGYEDEKEKKVLPIINLLLSGQVIEHLRINNQPIMHSLDKPDKKVESLCKSLFLSEAYFELIGGDVNLPYALIVVGNSLENDASYANIDADDMTMLALGNFTAQFSNAINNIIFYQALLEEKKLLEENIKIRTKQITEEKNNFETIYKTSKDGIAILDTETTAFLDINPAYCEMVGYTREELTRTSCMKLTVDTKGDCHVALSDVFTKGFVTNFEKDYRRKDNTIITVSMSITLMSDKKRMLVSAKNITKQKELERNILEEKRKAEESTKAKSQFLANMSHEIRTPMNGIIGMSHLALKTDLNEKQKSYIQNIDKSAKSLLGIINDILDFSKIEAGKLNIEKTEFNLRNLLSDIFGILNFKIEQKGLSLKLVYDNSVKDYLFADSLRLKQVLTNLLDNAVKFTKRGTIIIEVQRITSKKIGFKVIDSGIGLSEEQQKKLFKSFSQADGSTTRKYGGTGLGLSISKQLVSLMGGDIWVKSKLEEGAEFGFTIEVEESNIEACALNASENKIDILIDEIATFSGSKILICEDNIINQEIIVGLLEKFSFEVDIANNGIQALEFIKKNLYSLIFMDLQMPIMDGFETTKKIRKKDPNIPIIALSANVSSSDIEQTVKAGMNEHLKKPIHVVKLYTILEKYLSKTYSKYGAELVNLDVKKGLFYVNNNKKLYVKILKDFYDVYEDIKLESLSKEELKIALHTLNGLSNSIGALNLNIVVKNLEKTRDLDYLDNFYKKLEIVLDEINIYLDKEAKYFIKDEISEEETKVLFEELKVLVNEKRPAKCKKIVEKIDKYNLSKKYKKIFIDVKLYLDKYDFKSAIELLD